MNTWYFIANGKISGTYADGFHRVSPDGKIGFNLDRNPSSEERDQLLNDLRRHREVLLKELENLNNAEKALKKNIILKCQWCENGYIRPTGVLCGTCHGTGEAPSQTIKL